VSIGPGGTLLTVIPGSDLPSQRLSEHLYGSLRARVGHKPGCCDTLAYAEPIEMMRRRSSCASARLSRV